MNERELLDLLRDPACYPGNPASVTLIQTHISIVALAGELVFKVKKPLRLPFLDFTTLQDRRRTCRDEVRLNRRLCPDVYLGTAALRPTADDDPGSARFAAIGDDDADDTIEVAVVMRRLPADRMLDRLLADRAVSGDDIAALARQLARFHASAERGPQVLEHGNPYRLRQLALDNFDELAALPDHGLSRRLLDAMHRRTRQSFDALLPHLRDRAGRGRVVDGHGDLHARNICMTAPPSIYDCIEFQPAFRCGDVATEVAFLVMDLAYRDARPLARAFAAEYAAAADDPELPALLPPLVAYRAMVRAKVAALAAREPELPANDRRGARASAARHLQLAAATTLEADAPRWLLMCGPPGSGKSTLARALAPGLDWPILATDVVRKQLHGLAPTARGGPELYTAESSDRTYAAVLAAATAATATGAAIVVLDGNFPTAARRAAAAAAAIAAGARIDVLHVHVDADTGRQRLQRRLSDPERQSDAGPDQHDALRQRFAPPTAAERTVATAIDGTLGVAEQAALALASLLTDAGP